MKISNEIKVGVVTLLTIILFIWLFNFLKGKNYFKSTANYYCIYDQVGGLAESSPVEINGYKVGVVQSINFLNAESGKLIVLFSVSRDFRLPVNTVAEITPVSIIAGMKVQFVYGNGPGFYSEGDTIPGRLSESIITSFEREIIPIKNRINNLLDVLDSVISSVDEVMDPEFRKNLSGTMANLKSTTGSIDKIIDSREKELEASIQNLHKFSQVLSDNSEEMSGTFSNLKSISDTLAAADIYNTISSLKTTLEKTSILLENINTGDGTAGQLFTNDSLYKNLNGSLENLDLLLQDLKANPKKYVHFSVFGRK